MNPLELTGLLRIMAETAGAPEISIALIDGPVADHPALTGRNICTVPDRVSSCNDPDSMACRHGTFIAGILSARRGSSAPAICPACTLLVRPIFLERCGEEPDVPSAFPVELARAIDESIDQGAAVVNLSIELVEPCPAGDRELTSVLDRAADKGVIVAAAAGNQGIIGGSVLTRHPWVIPVAACDLRGRPTPYSNRTGSINRKGLMAPGEKVSSLTSNGHPVRFSGTSVSVPFVSGAAALLRSLFPDRSGAEIRSALTASRTRFRPRVPPLLDVWTTWEALERTGYAGCRKAV